MRKIGALSYFMYLNEGFLLQHKDKFAPFENIDIQNVCILIFSIILACCMKYIWKALSMFMFKGRMNNVKNFTGS